MEATVQLICPILCSLHFERNVRLTDSERKHNGSCRDHPNNPTNEWYILSSYSRNYGRMDTTQWSSISNAQIKFHVAILGLLSLFSTTFVVSICFTSVVCFIHFNFRRGKLFFCLAQVGNLITTLPLHWLQLLIPRR